MEKSRQPFGLKGFRQVLQGFVHRCPNVRGIRTGFGGFTLGSPNPGVIRTGLRGFCTSESECLGYSDRTSGFLHLGVRILGGFVQDSGVFALGSPNPGVIRTGLRGFCTCESESWGIRTGLRRFCTCESESWGYSDRTPAFLHLRVRILGGFGQDFGVFALASPNPRGIRTGLRRFCTCESESWRYSDSTSGFLHLRVQILGGFGQDSGVFALASPNPGVIRTGLRDFYAWESESWGDSDRTSGFLHLRVRILALFGQDSGIFTLGSPNPGGIRTGLQGFAYENRVQIMRSKINVKKSR